jgi:hypothetical protein
MLVAIGREYRPGRRIAVTGEAHDCALNALDYATAHELTYVQGLAVAHRGGQPTLHAWCADTQGRVSDPTWGQGSAYLGIPVHPMYFIEYIAAQVDPALPLEATASWHYCPFLEQATLDYPYDGDTAPPATPAFDALQRLRHPA